MAELQAIAAAAKLLSAFGGIHRPAVHVRRDEAVCCKASALPPMSITDRARS